MTPPQVRMLNRLAKEHAGMAGGIVLRQEPTDQRLNDRCGNPLIGWCAVTYSIPLVRSNKFCRRA